MTKALEIIEYITKIVNAISKGVKECVNNWPNNSPFGSDIEKEK